MKISVITINKNNRDGLVRTLDSVSEQSGGAGPDVLFEHIIIDGASSDGSQEVVKDYIGKVRYPVKSVSENDTGIYNAMNKGVALADGEYLLFINSGDALVSGILPKIAGYLDGTDLIYGNIYMTRDNIIQYHEKYNRTSFSIIDAIEGGLCLPHPSTFINRRLFEHRKYDERLKIVSDWKFWVEVITFDKCLIKHVDETISYFDLTGISGTNVSLTKQEIEETLDELFSPEVVDAVKFRKEAMPAPLYDIFRNSLNDYKFQKAARTVLKVPYRLRQLYRRMKARKR